MLSSQDKKIIAEILERLGKRIDAITAQLPAGKKEFPLVVLGDSTPSASILHHISRPESANHFVVVERQFVPEFQEKIVPAVLLPAPLGGLSHTESVPTGRSYHQKTVRKTNKRNGSVCTQVFDRDAYGRRYYK